MTKTVTNTMKSIAVLFSGLVLMCSSAHATFLSYEGDFRGNGEAFDANNNSLGEYKIILQNFWSGRDDNGDRLIDSDITITLADGSKVSTKLVYTEIGNERVKISSDDFGSGSGSCSGMFGPCTAKFGTEDHYFTIDLRLEGWTKSKSIKKEYVGGKLTTTYVEIYSSF